MTKDEVLKLALEALELSNANHWWGSSSIEKAITAIKEALMSGTDGAQPEHGWTPERIAGIARLKDAQDKRLAQLSVSVEQEPVTWRYKIVDVFGRPAWTLKTPKSDTRVLESQPLYTTPPQRKPLTDEEIKAMYIEKNWYEMAHAFTWGAAEVVARAIEAAHGIIAPTELKGEA